MPLPSAPKNRLNNAVNRATDRKADNELLFKGVLCALIGLCVLLAPYFLHASDLGNTIAQAAAVGWFALLLGCAFIGLYARRRWSAPSKG
ncbi:MAG: hypothetical protein ABJA49_14290 [Betaproteobacteria bacterium]